MTNDLSDLPSCVSDKCTKELILSWIPMFEIKGGSVIFMHDQSFTLHVFGKPP